MSHPVAALACGVAGLVSGVLVPRLIALVPPVEVDAPTETDPERTELVDVAALADLPRLSLGAAVVAGGCAALIGLAVGPAWPLLYLLALVPVCVALAVVDWHTRILPTRLIAPTYAVTVVLLVVAWVLGGGLSAGGTDGRDLLRAALGWLVAGGLYLVLWLVHPRGMGYGDVRLSGVLGIALGYLGWGELVVGVYGGFLLGGVIGGLLSLLRRVDAKAYPFGPFMLAGALVGVVFGQAVGSALRS